MVRSRQPEREGVGLSVHYLQSEAWLHLRCDFRKQKGVNVLLLPERQLRLIGHIAQERRARSIIQDSVLEIFYGPGLLDESVEIEISSEATGHLIQIALEHSIRKLRIFSYSNSNFGYYTLDEYKKCFREMGIDYKVKLSNTLIYPLNEHNYGTLDECDASVRKNLRKASEIRIIKAESPDQIEEYLVQHALLKAKRPPKPREISAYQRWKEGCVLFLAFNSTGTRCLGTLGFVHDDYLGTEIASATAKGPEARGAQEKLHLACFDEAKRLGLNKFDLAGIERDASGSWNSIARFKMKFGGQLVETGILEVDLRKLAGRE